MEAAALLDILGNENRRRILQLLAQKPCYVTEISEYLEVSPKAVIDHLRRLEAAGLIESRTDSSRRKYFHIARNLRLEVTVSQYGYGAKSAYPASRSLDFNTCCDHVRLDVPRGHDGDLATAARRYRRLQQLEQELSLAQRWVQGRLIETVEQIDAAVDAAGSERFTADLLSLLARGPYPIETVAMELRVPEATAAAAVAELAEEGIIRRTPEGWTLA
ncbi:MAG: metalloregulator ArsR/SmtB family transcription factor [Haloferacaceae archaeon]|nr:metalloregulator ArsR/SmtB family transcription factor [Haloferacaceae archaeon]